MEAPPAAGRSLPLSGPISSEQIQRCLDENQHLIAAILDHQNANRLADCLRLQHLLQQNLSFLSMLADFHPSTLHSSEPVRPQADGARPAPVRSAGAAPAPMPATHAAAPPPMQRHPPPQQIPQAAPYLMRPSHPATYPGLPTLPPSHAPLYPPTGSYVVVSSPAAQPPHLAGLPPRGPMLMSVGPPPPPMPVVKPPPAAPQRSVREDHERFMNVFASTGQDWNQLAALLGWQPQQAKMYWQSTILKAAWRLQRPLKEVTLNDLRREAPDLQQPTQQQLRAFVDHLEAQKRQRQTAEVNAAQGQPAQQAMYASQPRYGAAGTVNPAALVSGTGPPMTGTIHFPAAAPAAPQAQPLAMTPFMQPSVANHDGAGTSTEQQDADVRSFLNL